MFSETRATTHKLTAEVVMRPEFVGSLHDDEMARRLGYPAALVPGIDIYGYLARSALATWGHAWLERGSLSCTSFRPVYHGDQLVVYAEAMRRHEASSSVDISVHNGEGVMIATGAAGLAETVGTIPNLNAWPVVARSKPVPSGAPEDMREGLSFSSESEMVSADHNAQLVAEFRDPSRLYLERGIIHPAYLVRVALKNAHASFSHATPPIYIGAETQHYSPLRVGERIDVSGRITRLWERKGHHYMESDQLIIANGERAIMRVRRTTIYQARAASPEQATSARESRS